MLIAPLLFQCSLKGVGLMKQLQSRPMPIVTPFTQPYWDGALSGKLMIQRCNHCKSYYHPPVSSCAKCVGEEEAALEFEVVSGRGTVYSHTLIRDTRIKGFEDIMPYTVVMVELEEQPRLIHYANMPQTEADEITVGASVEVIFIDIGDGIKLPDFKLSS
ncbi:hypothetical protein FIM02_00230 [SAR202 cluster bacterium AD-802-E10_MRT_200m]|nr:hypothetical protein [SAR202 cluster bacterium AD-802-E10_MRT_200m]